MKLEWKRVEPTKISKVGWRTIVTKHFTLPDGTTHEYVTKDKEDAHCIATVAITDDNKIILARQFRPGPEKVMNELPGGGVEAGEDYETAARRELLEETGYAAGEMHFLGEVYKDAYTNTVWHYYLATGCKPHEDGPRPDEREFIEIIEMTIPELLALARTPQMTDSVGVFLAYDHLMRLQNNL